MESAYSLLRSPARRGTLKWLQRLCAVMGGVAVALLATFLLRLPYVWNGLFVVGIVVLLGGLLAIEPRRYWLALFALALPLHIKKVLIDSDIVRQVASIYGIPEGELPAPVIYLSDLPFLVLMGYWLLDIVFRGKRVEFPRSHWFAIAFLGWAALSLCKATAFSYGFFDLIRTIKFYLMCLYVVNNVRSVASVRTLMNSLLIGVILQGAICLRQYSTQNLRHPFGNLFGQQDLYTEETAEQFEEFFTVTPGSDRVRASGTVGPTNAEAQFFEYFLPVALLVGLAGRRMWQSCFHLLAFGAGMMGLVLTFSRGALLGVAPGLVSALVLGRKYNVISRYRFLGAAILGLLVVVATYPKTQQFIMSRHEATLSRFELYRVGFDMVRSNPILGVGLNNHITAKDRYDPETYAFPTAVHNQYLLIASEVGIPGLMLFTAFVVAAILAAVKAAKCRDPYLVSVAVGIVAAAIALGTHNLVDHLSYHTNLTLLWVFCGLSYALPHADENREVAA